MDSPGVAGERFSVAKSRTIRIALLSAPLLGFIFICALPRFCVRLSLIIYGHPCAQVVPKEKLNVFDFVPTDNFRSRAIVFSKGHAIGWVYQPMSGFARFVPFSAAPNFMDLGGFHWLFDYVVIVLSLFKWYWLMGAYVLLFGCRRSLPGFPRRRLTKQDGAA